MKWEVGNGLRALYARCSWHAIVPRGDQWSSLPYAALHHAIKKSIILPHEYTEADVSCTLTLRCALVSRWPGRGPRPLPDVIWPWSAVPDIPLRKEREDTPLSGKRTWWRVQWGRWHRYSSVRYRTWSNTFGTPLAAVDLGTTPPILLYQL